MRVLRKSEQLNSKPYVKQVKVGTKNRKKMKPVMMNKRQKHREKEHDRGEAL